MPKQTRQKREYKSASVPAEDYNIIKKWVDTGESPFVSADEAYRTAIRNILFKGQL